MTAELLRIPHSKQRGHKLVLYADPPTGFRLVTLLATPDGAEQVLEVVHLRAVELGPVAKAFVDALTATTLISFH